MESPERGRLRSRLVPQGVAIRTGMRGSSTSLPFPRSLTIYDNGLLVTALAKTVWIPREQIEQIRRMPGGMRIDWGVRSENNFVLLTSWFKAKVLAAELEKFGYAAQQ